MGFDRTTWIKRATLSACLTFTTVFSVSAYATEATFTHVRVYWSSADEIQQHCGARTRGCVKSADPDKPYVEIWARMPVGWDDRDNICALGNLVAGIIDDPAAKVQMADTQLERLAGAK